MISKNNLVDLRLGFFTKYAQGQVVWLPRGKVLFKNLSNIVAKELKKRNYKQIETPTICSNVLWEKTGHLKKFKENMFAIENNSLKPMNCPMHAQAFKHVHNLTNKIPIKFFEFSNCFRNESTGGLQGLFRLIKFTQDDSHVFCNLLDIKDVVFDFIEALKKIYQICELKLDFVSLSKTKESDYIGSISQKEKSENILLEVCKKANLKVEHVEGEGAFYGPKIDFFVLDNNNKRWQCGTVQLDFCMPLNLNLPCEAVVHHAYLGTFERFIGIILDNIKDKPLPFILNPLKIAVISVRNTNHEEAKKYWDQIKEKIPSFIKKSEIKEDFSNKDLSQKIKSFSTLRPNYIIIIGKEEYQNKTLNIRKENQNYSQECEDFIKEISKP